MRSSRARPPRRRELERHAIDSPGRPRRSSWRTSSGPTSGGIRAARHAHAPPGAGFDVAVRRRCSGTPIQYVTGDQAFRRLMLEVRPGVFIPRPETEMLVEAALEFLDDSPGPVVVDVGTGAGPIALAIADERPDAVVLATDLSPAAVALARRNAAGSAYGSGSPGGSPAAGASAGGPDRPGRLESPVRRPRSDGRSPRRGARGAGARARRRCRVYERLAAEAANALRPGGGSRWRSPRIAAGMSPT